MHLVQIPKLENMNSMFENCENLETIYMQDFNTKNVLSTNSAFEKCINLKKIYINYFDLTKVSDAYHMFSSCNSLKEITLKNDDNLATPINMKSIFNGDYSLERINLRQFNKKIIIC